MKKAIAILATVFIVSTVMNAQSDNTVRLGIKVAPNMSWIRSDTKGIQSDGNRIGYSAGLLVEFPFGSNGNYRFATGLNMTNLGGKLSSAYSADTANVITSVTNVTSLRLRYVDIPLTIKLMTNEIGYNRYFGQLGFDTGINVRAKSNDETIITVNNVTRTVTVDDIDRKEDVVLPRLGYMIGGGMEYNFSGSTSALVAISYHSGITPLLKKDAVDGFPKVKSYADFVELTLGVFF